MFDSRAVKSYARAQLMLDTEAVNEKKAGLDS